MSNQTAANVTPITQGKRHTEEVDGMTLDHEEHLVQMMRNGWTIQMDEFDSLPVRN